ncbi:MAG: reductive dehalogenase domain-containing protein [Bacillota bacterium]|jgi:epoxyqueuosine reductase QueG
MMIYNELMNRYFKSKGVTAAGYGSLLGLGETVRRGYSFGICIVLALAPDIIERIPLGPDLNCFKAINATNKRLKDISLETQEFIEKQGFKAFSQAMVRRDENCITPLPHKTVATLAGLGWIGKSNLLVVRDYGSAVRLSSILTNMPFVTAEPVYHSQCGNCNLCVTNCPVGAIHGTNWEVGVQRDALLDLEACRGAIARRNSILGAKGDASCSRCVAACKYSQEYLRRTKRKENLETCYNSPPASSAFFSAASK